MKGFRKLLIGVIVLMTFGLILANVLVIMNAENGEKNREYRIEINRLVQQMLKSKAEQNAGNEVENEVENKVENEVILPDISKCKYVTAVIPFEDSETFFAESDRDCVIRKVGEQYYRFEYVANQKSSVTDILWIINGILIGFCVLIFGILFYVRSKILKPFFTLSEMPYELSKGNLTLPLKENKNRFFGRFVWGMDLLRENLEEQKERELEALRDKKTLVLSVSHDIKTPLSAIKLYAKALSKGIYNEEQKQKQIAENISDKVDEIENFVSEIIKAENEEFLELPVNNEEFYLSRVLNRISEFYSDKLEYLKIHFCVESYEDCIISGDEERSVEVIQNVMENAIKYGDGRTISISVEYEETNCLVTVRNTGNSLTENELPHIFESFWRGGNAEKVKGSGLGLSISRRLMQKMAGEIFADICEGDMCITMVFELA